MPRKLDLAKKYELYIAAVQSPDTDVRFYEKKYRQFCGTSKKNLVLREDFCGTGIISTEWVKLSKNYSSIGVDLDLEPLRYGKKEFISKLKPDQQERIELVNKNVLDRNLPEADIIAAVNFSYFLFKKRELLLNYFTRVYESLNSQGMFMIDIFGGTQCTDEITDTHRNKGFTYYWEQKNFDPVTHFAEFAIHFKYKNQMYKNCFTYDWRMWSIPEVREIMKEAGFRESRVFWEGTNKDGTGNGVFSEVKKGEACLSWIAYVAGLK
jgi:ubiquinone/menaquinone biosynthesis C-methylase UbiE